MYKQILKPQEYLWGLLIGIANIIPGVSGGTIAVMLGIYKDLINAIPLIIANPFRHIKEFIFLLKIGIGALIGIRILSGVMNYLLAAHLQPISMFFIGLILGSIPIVLRAHNDMKLSISRIASFCLFFSLVTLLSLNISINISASSSVISGNLLLGISGFLAAGAMLIPGISGSFLLLLLGTYQPIIKAISNYNFLTLGIVALGAGLGLIIFSKLIAYLLNKYPAVTYWGILGLICGSCIKLWPGFPTFNLYSVLSIILFICGIILANCFSGKSLK